jgi:hypothetical protein
MRCGKSVDDVWMMCGKAGRGEEEDKIIGLRLTGHSKWINNMSATFPPVPLENLERPHTSSHLVVDHNVDCTANSVINQAAHIQGLVDNALV